MKGRSTVETTLLIASCMVMICVRKSNRQSSLGKSRFSSAAHEHDSSSLISRNDMAQQCERLLSNHAAHGVDWISDF